MGLLSRLFTKKKTKQSELEKSLTEVSKAIAQATGAAESAKHEIAVILDQLNKMSEGCNWNVSKQTIQSTISLISKNSVVSFDISGHGRQMAVYVTVAGETNRVPSVGYYTINS